LYIEVLRFIPGFYDLFLLMFYTPWFRGALVNGRVSSQFWSSSGCLGGLAHFLKKITQVSQDKLNENRNPMRADKSFVNDFAALGHSKYEIPQRSF